LRADPRRDRSGDSRHPDLHFSTTTLAIRTASEIAIMDAYSTYFRYVVGCLCDIPKFTVEGTPEDWQRTRDRVELLATFELEWWVSRLRRILDELVMAAEGHPTLEFWQAIYKPKEAMPRPCPPGGSPIFSHTSAIRPRTNAITAWNCNELVGFSQLSRESA